jgi:hypothetical protein
VPRLVQRLERHAAGQGAIAGDRDHIIALPGKVTGGGDSQRCGDGGGGVAGAEGIVRALLTCREPAEAALQSQGMEALPAAGEQLMGVRLMAYIPDDLVLRAFEHAMYSNGQFYSTQAGGQMPAVGTYHLNDSVPNLGGELLQLLKGKVFQVAWLVDTIQYQSILHSLHIRRGG